jgi:primosomal replication protein N
VNSVCLSAWVLRAPVRRVRADGREVFEVVVGFRSRDGSDGSIGVQATDSRRFDDLERDLAPGVVVVCAGELAGESVTRAGVVLDERRVIRCETLEVPARAAARNHARTSGDGGETCAG